MAFFSDFALGIQEYPAASVTLTISPPTLKVGTLGAVNINEVWSFKVRVTNDGSLNMKNVKLHVVGLSGATVSDTFAADAFSTSVISSAITIVSAKNSAPTAELYFKAPPNPSMGVVDLVDVHLYEWDADLSYLLNVLSVHTISPNAKITQQVFP